MMEGETSERRIVATLRRIASYADVMMNTEVRPTQGWEVNSFDAMA